MCKNELTDAASGRDPRAVTAFRDFLKKLIDNEAVCAVAVGEKTFSFRDVGEVRRGYDRLAKDNLREETKPFKGMFQGVLPKRRSFEFKIDPSGEVISGRIGPGVKDPAAINHHLEKAVEIRLVETRAGQGRPRYVLQELPVWQ